MWDVSAGVELAELPPSGNWNFAAAWSPTNPGVFATASFDGKVWFQTLADLWSMPAAVWHAAP